MDLARPTRRTPDHRLRVSMIPFAALREAAVGDQLDHGITAGRELTVAEVLDDVRS